MTVACLGFAAAIGPGCGESDRPPHVFLVTVDTLRFDHLSMNGYARATSPHVDAFAGGAWRFPDAITPIAKTGPSFTTMFSGLHPTRHGVDTNSIEVPPVPLLAERLAAAGYQTGAFVSNPVLRPDLGYARGFSRYFVTAQPNGVELVNRFFLAWAETVDWSRPVFVWIHYMDPHGPYVPPERFARAFADDAISRADARTLPLEYERLPGSSASYVLGAIPDYQQQGGDDRVAHYVAAYDAEILYTDAAIGELLDALRARGVLDASALLFTADHGESMGEQDYWFEHGWLCNDASLRIPFLLKPPGVRAGRDVPGSVSTLDVAPTLLALAGVRPEEPLPGRDLATAEPGREPIVVVNAATYPDRFMGVRTPDWKYVRRLRLSGPPVAPRADEELFDLRADPAETRNLVASEPERLAALRAELDRQLAATGPRLPARTLPIAPEVADQLRALGYTE
jgi:arylsulfatase A-like enzyme